MKRILILLSVTLILFGLVIGFIAFASAGFSFRNIGNKNAVTKNLSVTESFTSIEIDDESGYYDIKILPSESETAEIITFGDEDVKINFAVVNQRLSIEILSARSFFTIFDFSPNAYINVYIPQKEYRELKIESSSGDISLLSLEAELVDIEASSGDIFVRNSKLGTIEAETLSGDIELVSSEAARVALETTSGEVYVGRASAINTMSISSVSGDVDCESVILQGVLKIETASGDIELENSDAQKIIVETRSGDVEGDILSAKVFDARSSSGEVRVPTSLSGSGECYIRTSSGDIEISISGRRR